MPDATPAARSAFPCFPWGPRSRSMRLSLFERPDPRHGWLTGQAYAHRGLHGGGLHGSGIPENSRAAFLHAIRAGYGIELDVRLSRDGFAMVFHDADLERLTGEAGALSGRSADALGRLRLGGTADTIERLHPLLRFVGGRVPVLIELKTDGEGRVAARLCMSVCHALEGYRGPAAVMSFDPRVPAWFRAHAPRLPRGLVIGHALASGRGHRLRAVSLVHRLLSLGKARPHFIAHDVSALPSRLAARARRRGVPLLAWTVRSAQDQDRARTHADQIIFED